MIDNSTMENRAFDFATVGFRPYVDTKEFVTIGVIVQDVVTGEFDFSLLDADERGRIAAMFPKLVESVYPEARKQIQSDFEYIRSSESGASVFSSLLTPREGLFCFPVRGRRLASSMSAALAALGEKFVGEMGGIVTS